MELVKRLDARGMEAGEIAAGLRRADGFLSTSVREAARAIVEGVREGGDRALLDFTERFDGVRPENVRVPAAEIEEARDALSDEIRESFLYAIENVRAFHEREMDRSWEQSRGGATTGQRVRPIRRAGLYVPGGHGAYPSTLVMSAVPAQVAGVGEIRVSTPPGPDGRADRGVLAVAGLLGLDEVYTLGGAQAVGALAFGTETVPRVDKIVGPGNDFVTAAKLEVFGVVGIDAPQGPSEAMVIADAGASPERVARDLMAQAALLSGEPADLITLVRVRDDAQAVEISNAYAPEHAHVISEDHESILQDLDAVGMVAVGDFSPVALGDYAAGPSHALPTGGPAAWASPLGTHDFTVRTNYLHYTSEALAALGPHVEQLARLEGFENHAKS